MSQIELIQNMNDMQTAENNNLNFEVTSNRSKRSNMNKRMTTEEELKAEVVKLYPESVCEFFKRPQTQEFTGIIKVTFKDEDMLKTAIENKIVFGRLSCRVEEYIRKVQVVKCHRCQKFRHIARRCRSEKPKCGKCCRTNHETKDCTNTSNFKCAHCNGSHITGSASCPEWKRELERLRERNNHGY